VCPNCPFHHHLPRWSSVIQAFQVCDWVSFCSLDSCGDIDLAGQHSLLSTSLQADRVSFFLGRDIGQW
jgi:hypothetical protein